MDKATSKPQQSINLVFRPAMMVPLPTTEFAQSVTSSVPPVSEAQLTASLALPIKSSMRVDAGPLAPPFFSPTVDQAARNASVTVLMDFTRSQSLSAHLAHLNAPPAIVDQITAPLVFKDQCPSTVLALSTAERISSASKEFAWPAQFLAMDAQSVLLTVLPALQDTSSQDPFVKRAARPHNSSTPTKKCV